MALVIALASLAACGADSPPPVVLPTSDAPTTSVDDGVPIITGFRADPSTIAPGQKTVLLWEVDDVDATLSVDQGVGPVSGASQVVAPQQTTAYTLTATSAGGTATAQATVTVAAGGAASDPISIPTGATATWENVTGNLAGQPSECANLADVSVRPDVDVVLAAVALHGMWANTDPTTAQWDPIGTGPGSAEITNRPTSFVYDPQHPGTWWQSGTYVGGGVFQTTDGGSTFRKLGDIGHVDSISVDLTDPGRTTMIAGRHELTDVQRSTDGGETWAPLPSLPPGVGATPWALLIDANTYLLGSPDGDNPGLYRTTDGGTTWTQMQAGPVAGAPLVASDGTIYWAIGGDLVASGDGGATWTTRARRRLDTGFLVELEGGQLGSIIGTKVAISGDGGVTWTLVGAPMPYEPQGLAYSIPRKAFYIWHSDCRFDGGDNPVLEDAIMREVIS